MGWRQEKPAERIKTTYEFQLRSEDSDDRALYEWVQEADVEADSKDYIELRVRRVRDDQDQDLLELEAVRVEEAGGSKDLWFESVAPAQVGSVQGEVQEGASLYFRPRMKVQVAPLELEVEPLQQGTYELRFEPQEVLLELEPTLDFTTPGVRSVDWWSPAGDAPDVDVQVVEFEGAKEEAGFWGSHIDYFFTVPHKVDLPSPPRLESGTKVKGGEVEVWFEAVPAAPAPPKKPRRTIAYF